MFTSDVSARGVDYPDVSLVLQVRPPSPALLLCTVDLACCVREHRALKIVFSQQGMPADERHSLKVFVNNVQI